MKITRLCNIEAGQLQLEISCTGFYEWNLSQKSDDVPKCEKLKGIQETNQKEREGMVKKSKNGLFICEIRIHVEVSLNW